MKSMKAMAISRKRAVEVSGGGDIELTAAGSGVVKLQDASQSFVRGNDFDAQLDSFLTAQTTFITALAAAVSAISVYANAIAQPAVLPTTAPANATLQTALVTTFAPQVAVFNAALASFQSSSSLWLSTRVKGQ
jgi:hypothetical protein